jgi:membrane fusion protein (multidrug efflux system)
VEWPAQHEDQSKKQDHERGDKPPRKLLRRHPFAIVIGAILLLLAAAGGYLYWNYA